MTEKEIFINMIKTVTNNLFGEYWTEEKNGDFSIFNESNQKTTFEFDEEGDLIGYY